jgi:hypothetical protein
MCPENQAHHLQAAERDDFSSKKQQSRNTDFGKIERHYASGVAWFIFTI